MSRYFSLESYRRAYDEVRQHGDFAPLVDAYVGRLARGGYLPSTTREYLRALAHFLYWFRRKDRDIGEIDARLIKCFLDRHLPVCRCAPWCGRSRVAASNALARLLELVRDEGWITSRAPPAAAALEAELTAFDRHLVEVCGLSESTRQDYLWPVRRFLSSHCGAGRLSVDTLTAQDVRRFIGRLAARRKPVSMRSIGSALRSYFKFKTLQGAVLEPLIRAIPRVMRWRPSSLPPTLTEQQIQQLLGALDLYSAQGLRDYAMLRCLIDLGLRAGEVARMQLQDVDWHAGTLRIPGKGRRVQLLPLPRTVGAALTKYLRHGRPQIHSRALFVHLRAPLNKPVKTSTIIAAVRAAARRCGWQGRIPSTHELRHSVAARLVQRGASLKLIADLLRHRSLDTTTIYAKVDFPALRRVALPWPGSRS